MKLVLVKVDHYPNFDIPKIYHGCGFKKNDGFNELIDRANGKMCSSPAHMVYWKFCNIKRHKVSNERYVTRSFLKELIEKGYLICYKTILYLDEQKRN